MRAKHPSKILNHIGKKRFAFSSLAIVQHPRHLGEDVKSLSFTEKTRGILHSMPFRTTEPMMPEGTKGSVGFGL